MRRGEYIESAAGEILLVDPPFQIRAAVLDHRTPLPAYVLEPSTEIKVRKERLATSGLRPGPWLTELKRAIVEREDHLLLKLPGGIGRRAPDSVSLLAALRIRSRAGVPRSASSLLTSGRAPREIGARP
jgi:ribonuclease BN (tRNA processing enzyme)